MKQFLSRSFRNRLFAAFLLVSLVPLLICSALLLQMFRIMLTNNEERETNECLAGLLQSMDVLTDGVEFAAAGLQEHPTVASALIGGGVADTEVNSVLFSVTEGVRSYARFDLYTLSGERCYSTRNGPGAASLSPEWGILHTAASRAGENVYIAGGDETADDRPLLQAARLIFADGEPVGYLLASVNEADFHRLLDNKFGVRNDVLILSSFWRPVFSTQSAGGDVASALRSCLLSGQLLDTVSDDIRMIVREHTPSGLFLVLQQPEVMTHRTMRLLISVSLACALLSLAVSVLMSSKLSSQMTSPIDRLQKAFAQVRQNDLNAQVSGGEDEFGQLSQQFNSMVTALRRNQEALVENERELNEAQIRMLQAQLNPHFLCNTLDTMKWISKINKMPQVAVMSTNLADILRFCISPDELVTLQKEAEILERYIEIQKVRLSDKFTFSMEIPVEFLDCLVPKMILQPIVENAILHGLDGCEHGWIGVSVSAAEDGLMRITVSDSGSGLPGEMLGAYHYKDRTHSRGHLGLYNVDTILTKYYGESCGLFLENRAEGGAAVTARLPIRYEEDEGC